MSAIRQPKPTADVHCTLKCSFFAVFSLAVVFLFLFYSQDFGYKRPVFPGYNFDVQMQVKRDQSGTSETTSSSTAGNSSSSMTMGTSKTSNTFNEQVISTTEVPTSKASSGSNDSDRFWTTSPNLCVVDSINNDTNNSINDTRVLVLILVNSAPKNRAKRKAIRETWAKSVSQASTKATDVILRLGFVIGSTPNGVIKDLIARENEEFGDIVLLATLDDYFQLTQKMLALLHWVSEACNISRFVMKADDDVFINVPLLKRFLSEEMSNENATNVIYGRLASKWKPNRDHRSKYFISEASWPGTYLPDFLTGPAYIMTSDCVDKILNASSSLTLTRSIHLEDVVLTGIAAESAGIRRQGVRLFLNAKLSVRKVCEMKKFISVHNLSPTEMRQTWARFGDKRMKRC